MRFHSIDYRKDRGERAGTIVNRGFWLNGVPRLILLCRLFGHRPVVDGYDSGLRYDGAPGDRSRWVCCARCGIRPDTQGRLDPDLHHLGQRYLGPYGGGLPADAKMRREVMRDLKSVYYPPGPWPSAPTGTLGGQLVIGRQAYKAAAEVKIGNRGSEHVLAAHVEISPLFGLYLHSEDHGQWLQRRLNPNGYHSRVTGLSFGDGHLYWRVWANRDESSSDTPRWRDGSINLSLLDRVLGPKRYSYEDVETVVCLAHLPHGDEHLLTLKLQRVTHGRARGRKKLSWSVEWASREGISDGRPGRETLSASVDVSDLAVEEQAWPAAALAAIAVQVTGWRTRNGQGALPDALAPGM